MSTVIFIALRSMSTHGSFIYIGVAATRDGAKALCQKAHFILSERTLEWTEDMYRCGSPTRGVSADTWEDYLVKPVLLDG